MRYYVLELSKLRRRPGGFPGVSAYALDKEAGNSRVLFSSLEGFLS